MREGIQKTYEVRAVVFQFLESTRSGTPRDPWMKGEPTPAWDHGTRGSSPFWLGEGRVPRGNVATPEAFVFGVGEPGFLQAGRGSAVWETCTEYHCTPTKVFLSFSQSLRRPPTVAMCLKAQAIQLAQGPIKPTGSIYRAQIGVKRCSGICLLVETSGKGLGCSLTLEPLVAKR